MSSPYNPIRLNPKWVHKYWNKEYQFIVTFLNILQKELAEEKFLCGISIIYWEKHYKQHWKNYG